MRKAVVVLIILLVAGVSIAYLLFRLTRKPAPTPVGWRARLTTLAGDGSPLTFSDPFGIAVARDGTVYVADAGENNRIRKIAADGSITTIAGHAEGFSDGLAGGASFNTPSGLAIDADDNLYIADTGNNRIRKMTPEGQVSTIAGNGTAGYVDGPGHEAQFNGPIGIAVDGQGNVFVADSYNDRIRKISVEGEVSTVAGGGTPGYVDGDAGAALFDTPCGIAVATDGTLFVADTANHRLRKITTDGKVTTLPAELSRPAGLALTHDNFLYVTELDRSRVIQIAPDGSAHVISEVFNQLAGVAIDPRSEKTPALYVADPGNFLVRKLDANTEQPQSAAPANEHEESGPPPRITNATLGEDRLLWPLDPQDRPHEVVATIGEVRGSFDSTDSRHHLHSGLDISGAYGEVVRAVRNEKVASPLPNWGLDSLNEGFRVGVVSYIHIHVGRDKDGKLFADHRFIDQTPLRVRIKRGTRFRTGEALGTVNRMYHVHLNIGPPGGEINPLSLSPVGFKDDVAPVIEKNGIQLFDQSGAQLTEKRAGRLVIGGRVRIVVDAFDRANMNSARRRLGLYRLGYQVLNADGSPAPGFAEPRINIVFDRLPPNRDSTKVAYAEESGITVYGSKSTRFLYEVTNTVRAGSASSGFWDTSELAPGDYVLRIIATDFSGNEVQEGRDVPVTIGT